MRFKNLVVVLFVLDIAAIFSSSVVAEEKFTTALIPREVLFGNPERAKPQISPDGTHIGYLAPTDGVLNVWIRTLGKNDDRPVTTDTKRGIRNFIWQFDNKHILFTQDVGGDENWRLFQTDIATKHTRDLTPYDKVRVDVLAYQWEHPDTVLIQANRRDPKLFDVYRVDLRTGKVDLDIENPGDVQAWGADNALQVRAAQVDRSNVGTIVRVRNDAKSPWRELIKLDPDDTHGGIAGFSPDNRKIWIVTSAEANSTRLLEIDIASGKRKPIAADPQFDVQDLITQPKTHALQAVTFVRQRLAYEFIDRQLKLDFEVLAKARHGDIRGLSQTWTTINGSSPSSLITPARPAMSMTA